MATFKKGQSMKGVRVHAASVFDQKGQGMDGVNVAFSVSNDLREQEAVDTAPMLNYGSYIDPEGNKKNTFTASYSRKQWEAFEKAANKDGDAMVVEADLFPSKNGKGLVVNTNSLKTPEQAFSQDKHRENTVAARDAKKAARDAAQQRDQQKAQDRALEV